MALEVVSLIRKARSLGFGISAVVGLIMYAAYGYISAGWAKPELIAICLLITLSLPFHAQLCNHLDRTCRTAANSLAAGRIGRLLPQVAYNAFLFWAFACAGIIDRDKIEDAGGIFGMSVFTSLNSQGGQYVALYAAALGLGSENRNLLLSFVVITAATAISTMGWPTFQEGYVAASLVIGLSVFVSNVLQDVRRRRKPGSRRAA